MQPNEIQSLYEYACWATALLLDKAEEITPEQFVAPTSFPWVSIRGTLAHILSAQDVWRWRMAEGVSPTTLRDFAEYTTLPELRGAYAEMEGRWRGYLASLTEEQLAATVAWKNTKGNEATAPLWQVLTHLVNHSTQHNSEVAQMLTELGHSPGNIDLIYWVIQQNRRR